MAEGKKHASVDTVYNKFSRLFMVYMLTLVSFVMSIEYFTNRMNCSIPDKLIKKKDFIHASCWSSGLFIYQEMTGKSKDSFYYGIPNNIKHDGLNSINKPCATHTELSTNPKCKPMTKVYYTQYQWLPFYIGLLALIYYLPYPIFKMVNPDLISLHAIVESTEEADGIVYNYFNYDVNPIYRLRLRVWLNILVQMSYIVVNVFSFCFTGYLLNGNYEGYGNNFFKTGNHTKMEENINKNSGQILLPSRGLCEVRSFEIEDNRREILRCEVPANTLYQYTLFVLWNLFVIGVTVSVTGLVTTISGHIFRFLCYGKTVTVRRIFRYMTLREVEYLLIIKQKNMLLYGDVIRKLKDGRTDADGKFVETCSLVSSV